MRRFGKLLLILCLAATLTPTFSGRAQSNITESSSVSYDFGQRMVFQAQVEAGVPIQSARLYFFPEGNAAASSGQANVLDDHTVEYTADISQERVRAFSNIRYWFEIEFKDGETYKTREQTFFYDDNRYEWQSHQEAPFRVHWYQGGSEFGQALLDVAKQGLEQAGTILPVTAPDQVDIYAYSSAADMRTALQLSTQNWVGAHTDPDLNVMLVSLPEGPEQQLEMERQIPHELMHILVFQMVGTSYANLPTWFNEGLASVAELYPNPDYLMLLNSARKKDNLLPIASLCGNFPRDASGAYLAYAESASFTRFLQAQYGSSGLEAVLSAYADGMDCERGLQVGLDASLPQLERKWQQETFGINPVGAALGNLLPWLALMFAVLAVPLFLIINGARKRPKAQRTANKRSEA